MSGINTVQSILLDRSCDTRITMVNNISAAHEGLLHAVAERLSAMAGMVLCSSVGRALGRRFKSGHSSKESRPP